MFGIISRPFTREHFWIKAAIVVLCTLWATKWLYGNKMPLGKVIFFSFTLFRLQSYWRTPYQYIERPFLLRRDDSCHPPLQTKMISFLYANRTHSLHFVVQKATRTHPICIAINISRKQSLISQILATTPVALTTHTILTF